MTQRALEPTLAIAWYTFAEALASRLLWLIIGFLAAGFSLAAFVSQVAITESVSFQTGFLGAFCRLCGVFTVSLFVVSSTVREFDDKVFEQVLSLPIPRAAYYLGKLAGFGVLALLVAALSGLMLAIYVPLTQTVIWTASFGCELVLICALSLLCLFTFSQVTLALSAVLAFYLLARTVAAVQLISSGSLVGGVSVANELVGGFIDALAFVLPELHRFTLSEWLIYHTGQWSDLWPVVGQTAVYLMLLSAAALFDLYRKNF